MKRWSIQFFIEGKEFFHMSPTSHGGIENIGEFSEEMFDASESLACFCGRGCNSQDLEEVQNSTSTNKDMFQLLRDIGRKVLANGHYTIKHDSPLFREITAAVAQQKHV